MKNDSGQIGIIGAVMAVIIVGVMILGVYAISNDFSGNLKEAANDTYNNSGILTENSTAYELVDDTLGGDGWITTGILPNLSIVMILIVVLFALFALSQITK